MINRLKNIDLKELLICVCHIAFKFLPFYIITSIFKGSNRNIWIISERSNEARDNGYWLFKYIRENHPENEVYYAIDYKCDDYAKVKQFGNVVDWGSIKHYGLLCKASIIASTDFGLGFPRLLMRPILMRLIPLKQKFVFLQHGITKDNLTHAKKIKLRADLFVCGAKPEYDYILENFGYSTDELKYLGLARFDNLINTNQSNQILYMPTWRNGLSEYNFCESGFFKAISSFLASHRLREILSYSNTKLIFFLHPAFRDRKKYFELFACDKIEIANNDDYDLQSLLKSSSLLITDYSSIYFDFAYMGKPVIYYQFDYDDYRKAQYKEGYFNYEKNGFGPVVYSEDSVLTCIFELIGNKWESTSEYKTRSQKFFPLCDNLNCCRHYNELIKLVSSNQK